MDTQNHNGESSTPSYKLALAFLIVFFVGQVTGYYAHKQTLPEKPVQSTPTYNYDSYYEDYGGEYEVEPEHEGVIYGDDVI